MLASVACALLFDRASVVAAASALPNDEISPFALFNRCYGTIVRRRAPKAHPLTLKVIAGTLEPIEACKAILLSGMFNAETDNQEEKERIIQTFSDFHRTWFLSDNYLTALPLGEIYGFENRLMRDPGEPAHYVTRSMFTQSVPYSTVLTESSGMLAIRSPDAPEAAFGQPGFPPVAYTNAANVTTRFDPPLSASGNLVNVMRTADNPAFIGSIIPDPAGWGKPIPLHQHFGGGVLGSQAFLQLNFGRAVENNDGGIRVPRRWSKAVLRDLLCRDVPAIRLEDAKPFVEAASELPFRKQAACMQCHSSMDPLANTARNLRYFAFNFDQINFGSNIHMVDHALIPGADFANSKPDGKIFFRSYSGELVDKPVVGLQQLGDTLADLEDPYVCAASRYFELFTGLRVSLQDLGDTNNPQLSAADHYYRELVIDVGLRFKQHQSIVTMISDIIDSDFYKRAGMRRAVSVE